MNTKNKTPKRYNLIMPDELATAVEQAAKDERITLVAFFRQCIKLGLLVNAIKKDPDSALLVQRGDKIERIVFV